jgi:hypothetical protein
LKKGFGILVQFIDEIIENGFVKEVKKGEINIIDSFSKQIMKSKKCAKNNIKSLLSKTAFLINPSVFSLYDSVTKESLWKIIKMEGIINRNKLDNYEIFYNQIQNLKSQFYAEGNFINAFNILKDYRNTKAFKFFNNNHNAFELRIIDKYLWLKGQKNGERVFNNEQYAKLLKLG